MIDQIRHKAKELLETKTVDCVIGYERATDNLTARPVFIYETSQVNKLIFDETCVHNLSKYLIDRRHKPTGIVAKPCDTRGINLLLNEKQLRRENLFIIGVVCFGVKKVRFNRIEDSTPIKCQYCPQHIPYIYDFLVGEPIPEVPSRNYADVIQIENLAQAERKKFWSEHFTRCIRCYGCRQVCVGCYCYECFVDELDPLWVGIRIAPGENWIWNAGRGFHLSARCVSCGECERVCPVNIPLMLINRKLERDTLRFFNFEPGINAEITPPFASYKKEDKLGIGE